ncbi:hypothetical protein V8C86DRAFT_701581 [Haematococcus lacustris]
MFQCFKSIDVIAVSTVVLLCVFQSCLPQFVSLSLLPAGTQHRRSRIFSPHHQCGRPLPTAPLGALPAPKRLYNQRSSSPCCPNPLATSSSAT